MRLPDETESVCPVCLRPVGALLVPEGDEVLMKKSCPEHGDFSCVVWRGVESWKEWRGPKVPPAPDLGRNPACPEACGLCSFHAQKSCAVVLDVTSITSAQAAKVSEIVQQETDEPAQNIKILLQ